MVGDEQAEALRERTQRGRGELAGPAAVIAQGVEAHEPGFFAGVNRAVVGEEDELLAGMKAREVGAEVARGFGLEGMEDELDIGGLAR